MNYFLIINPCSRSERSRKYFNKILAEFRNSNVCFDYVFASSFESIQAQSEFANRNGYDAIIAVGGDGTINATINGFYDENGMRISEAIFGTIYTGTSPDFCRSYKIPLDCHEAIQAVLDPHFRRIRLGKILFHKENSPKIAETRFFACCANIGLGADVAKTSNKIRKYTRDFIGTLISILWNLAICNFKELNVISDESEHNIGNFRNVSVGRTKFIASGLKVSKGISDHDERFYMLIAKNISIPVIPKLLYQFYKGKFTSPELLELSYSRKLTFTSPDSNVGVEFDGDPAGTLPCSIDLAQDPLELIIGNHINYSGPKQYPPLLSLLAQHNSILHPPSRI